MMVYPVCSVLLQNCFWKYSVTYPPNNYGPNTVLLPTLSYVLEYTNFQASMLQFNCQTSVLKSICPTCSSSDSFPRLHHPGDVQISIDMEQSPGFGKQFQLKLGQHSAETQAFNDRVLLDSCNGSSKSPSDSKERRKKRKKIHGNKGRVPWNKGRKHTSETRALIKQRTMEVLRDPQVRKKMAEHPRFHSDEVKKKIGSSLKRLWDKRLKWKKLGEKFFLSWNKSIAEAAKKGGIDQQELDWDSYDKIKEEITIQQLQSAMEKAKAKELAKIRAKRAAQAKAEKMAMLAQKRKEREEKARAKEACRKPKRKADKLSVVQELTLKQRLIKIRKKKSVSSQVVTQKEALIVHSPAWKKLDVKLMKREKVQREVSLADQIRAAKSKRTEPMATEALAESYTEFFHLEIARVIL